MTGDKKARKAAVILTIGKYAVVQDSTQYIATELKGKEGTINHKANSYHPRLKDALQNLSERLIKDKLEDSAKDRPLQLNELKTLIEQHIAEFERLTKGL